MTTLRSTLSDVVAAVGRCADGSATAKAERLRDYLLFGRAPEGYDPRLDLSDLMGALEAAGLPLLALELQIEAGGVR